MIIGSTTCQQITTAIYELLIFNVAAMAILSGVIIFLIIKLRKDNGILARMINKIAGDLPH